MKLSKNGAAFIAHFEGVFLYAYPDPGTNGEPWTIGIGSTHFDGMGRVRPGDRITLPRAIARFRKTMDTKYGPSVTKAIRRQMNAPMFDALASFHYNTGAIRSGSVDDKFNRGDDAAALATWAQYKKAGGRVMAGLVRRRKAEIDLWKTGRYPSFKIMIKETRGGSPRYIAPSQLPWDGQPTEPTITTDFPLIETPPLPERRPEGNFLVNIIAAIWRFLTYERHAS